MRRRRRQARLDVGAPTAHLHSADVLLLEPHSRHRRAHPVQASHPRTDEYYVKHIKADRLVYRGEGGVYMLPACHNCDLFITAMTGGCESRSIADRQRMPWVHNGTAAAGA